MDLQVRPWFTSIRRPINNERQNWGVRVAIVGNATESPKNYKSPPLASFLAAFSPSLLSTSLLSLAFIHLPLLLFLFLSSFTSDAALGSLCLSLSVHIPYFIFLFSASAYSLSPFLPSTVNIAYSHLWPNSSQGKSSS